MKVTREKTGEVNKCAEEIRESLEEIRTFRESKITKMTHNSRLVSV